MPEHKNPSDQTKKDALQRFVETLKPHRDVYNAIAGIKLAILMLDGVDPVDDDKLQHALDPVKTWQEYFAAHGPAQGFALGNREDDDPTMVTAFNDLVHQFNAERERIIQERDSTSLIAYDEKFRKIIYE
ncbi:MAG: hypothetical protein WC817_00970 [Patescibacteria group bacterium]|jgi:hypothetical protein